MGLRRAPRMRLVGLDLGGNVGMTDVGLDTIIALLSHGVLGRLESLSLTQNAITKKGALALTRALMEGVGLPALRKLRMGGVKRMEEAGIMMLAVALTQCPKLHEWDMDSRAEGEPGDYAGVEVHAGREGDIAEGV